MESYSLIVACLTMYTGMFYVTGSHYSYMENDGASWFLLIVLILPNLVFFIYWFTKMRIEILKIVYNLKRPWLFKIISCGVERYELFAEKYLTKNANAQDDMPKSKENRE